MGLLAKVYKFFQKDKYEEANYLSLVLTSDRVAALIWTFDEGQIKELGFGQKVFTNIDLLLHQTAVAIDTAGEEAKIDFEKTVFGLSSYWMEGQELSQKSTKILKKISDELELDPQAFVPLAVGINHLLKIEKFPSPQVIAIGIFGPNSKQAFCEVNLIDKDKVVNTKTTQLPPTADQIQRLIEELKEDDQQLPARIIIYGIGENEDLAQKITKIDWAKLFLHEPKIEFLDEKSLARSVAYAQAADLLGHEPLNLDQKPADIPKQKEQARESVLGFIEGEDILLSKKEPEEPEEPEEVAVPTAVDQTYAVETKSRQEEVQEYFEPKARFAIISKLLNLIKFPPNPKKIAIILLILIFLASVSSFAAGQFLTRAEIVIKVNASQHQATFTTTVPGQIPAETIKGTAGGNQKAVTTGSKKIGEKARGEVTVFNWTSSPKIFPSGTTIITKNGLKFAFDEPVEATSASAPSGSNPGSPGKSKVKITAEEVGPSHNLESGQDFTFTQFDEFSYSTQNEAPITGGAQRQVTTVTKEDMDRLEKSLTETITARASEDLKDKAAGKMVIDSAINIKITKKQFDKKLDEEASLLSLDMEIEAESFVFDENELKKLLADNTNSNLDEKSQARPENIEISQINSRKQEEGLILSGDFKANLVPRFNEDELAKQIAAKSPKETRSIIKQTPEVTDVLINYSPNIPFITSIPRDPEKITFKIEVGS